MCALAPAVLPLPPRKGRAANSSAYRSAADAAALLAFAAGLVSQVVVGGRLVGPPQMTLVLNTCGLTMGALLSPGAQNAG